MTHLTHSTNLCQLGWSQQETGSMVTWLVKTPLSYSRSTFFSDEWNMFFGLSEETEFEHPKPYLGGGFKHSLFLPLIGEMIQFDYIILFRWVETTNQISLPLYVFFFKSCSSGGLDHWSGCECYQFQRRPCSQISGALGVGSSSKKKGYTLVRSSWIPRN